MSDLTPIPLRIQLKRTKGFNLQGESRKLNDLPAVNCSRMGKWGNPFKIYEVNDDYLGKTYYVYNGKSKKGLTNIVFSELYFKNKERINADLFEITDDKREAVKISIELFEKMIMKNDKKLNPTLQDITSKMIKKELKGKNLACFCKLNEPCHCDILLKIANTGD
jgi:hypothetical protein